jgi:hypothetical protein
MWDEHQKKEATPDWRSRTLLSLPLLTLPADPAADDNKTLNRIWEKEVNEYVKRKTYLDDNMKTVYSIIWGQCTDVMRQKTKDRGTGHLRNNQYRRRWIGTTEGHQRSGVQLSKSEIPTTRPPRIEAAVLLLHIRQTHNYIGLHGTVPERN